MNFDHNNGSPIQLVGGSLKKTGPDGPNLLITSWFKWVSIWGKPGVFVIFIFHKDIKFTLVSCN